MGIIILIKLRTSFRKLNHNDNINLREFLFISNPDLLHNQFQLISFHLQKGKCRLYGVTTLGKSKTSASWRTTIRLVGINDMLNVTELTCRENKGTRCAGGLQWTLNMLLFSIWSQTDGSGPVLECCLFSVRLLFDLTSLPVTVCSNTLNLKSFTPCHLICNDMAEWWWPNTYYVF